MIHNPIASTDILPYLLGMLTAAVVGFAAMKLLAFISKRSNFTVFSFYCWVVGMLAIILC